MLEIIINCYTQYKNVNVNYTDDKINIIYGQIQILIKDRN